MNTTTTTIVKSESLTSDKGIKQLLCHALDMTAEQMFWHIHSYGMGYLQYQCQGDKWGMELLSGEKFYWNWFTAEWRKRDHYFFEKHHIYEYANDRMNAAQIKLLRIKYAELHYQHLQSDLLDKQYCHIVSLMCSKKPSKQPVTTI